MDDGRKDYTDICKEGKRRKGKKRDRYGRREGEEREDYLERRDWRVCNNELKEEYDKRKDGWKDEWVIGAGREDGWVRGAGREDGWARGAGREGEA